MIYFSVPSQLPRLRNLAEAKSDGFGPLRVVL